MQTTPDGRPLFPIAVLIFVIRDGTLLLGKRKEGYGTGEWCVPGGHLEFGEGLVEAAHRELLEETGLKAQSLTFKNIVNRQGKESQYLHVTFLADGVTGEPEVREPDRCEEWGWFPLAALPQPLFEWNKDPLSALQDGRLLVDAKRVV